MTVSTEARRMERLAQPQLVLPGEVCVVNPPSRVGDRIGADSEPVPGSG